MTADRAGRRGGDRSGGRARLIGIVSAYDQAVGMGEIKVSSPVPNRPGSESAPVSRSAGVADADSASLRYGFHCTQIADGSRLVKVGTVVTFGLLPGRGGRWEAADVRPTAAAADE